MVDFELYASHSSKNYVFFLHGWGGSKESFYLVKNHIANYCNMVFVSFSGFGNSKEPSEPYSLNDFAIELKELVIKIAKGKKVMLVCHSFGARVAAKFINAFPELVSKLLIVDGAGVKPKRNLSYYVKINKYKRLKKKVLNGKLPNSVLDKYGSQDYKVLSKVMKQTFINVVNEDLKKDFQNISCPTIIFWGKDDKETPLYMAKKIKKWIEKSELVIIKNAGHFSYIDDKLTFIEVLKYFILKLGF